MVEEIKNDLQNQLNNPNTKAFVKSLVTATEFDKKIFDLATRFPPMTSTIKFIIFILNLIIPGTGTMLLSTRYKKCSKIQLIIAILQLIMSWEIVGWIWSITWGVLAFIRQPYVSEEQQKLNTYNKDEVYNMSQLNKEKTPVIV